MKILDKDIELIKEVKQALSDLKNSDKLLKEYKQKYGELHSKYTEVNEACWTKINANNLLKNHATRMAKLIIKQEKLLLIQNENHIRRELVGKIISS